MTAPHERPPSEWPSDTCGEPALAPCDGCGRAFLLLVLVDGKQLCGGCWTAAGRPWPITGPARADALHRAEVATRARMIERGGAFANAVRNGKT